MTGSPAPAPGDPVEEAARRWGESYPDPAGFRALVSLVRGYAVAVREAERLLRPHGLTISRLELLLLLSFRRDGALPMSRIRDLLMVHGSSVTYLVGRLEAAGLVRRVADPDDRRVSMVTITDRGRARVDEAAVALAAGGFGALGALGGPERERLADLLARLHRPPADAPAA